MAGKQVYAALMAVQRDLKAPKNQNNTFGKYKYRSAEDIIEAVKPLLNANGLVLRMEDSVELIGNRYYIKATVSVIDVANGDEISTTAMAREPEVKKGMDDSQITGTASSYARKYALNGLFAIDDTKDADSDEYQRQTKPAQTRVAQKPQSAPNVQQGATAGNNDELYKKALFSLTDAIKAAGVTSAEAIAVAEAKYGKSSTRDMTLGEISDLAAHLGDYLMELGA